LNQLAQTEADVARNLVARESEAISAAVLELQRKAARRTIATLGYQILAAQAALKELSFGPVAIRFVNLLRTLAALERAVPQANSVVHSGVPEARTEFNLIIARLAACEPDQVAAMQARAFEVIWHAGIIQKMSELDLHHIVKEALVNMRAAIVREDGFQNVENTKTKQREVSQACDDLVAKRDLLIAALNSIAAYPLV
jgi:hypothetical protein